MIKPRTEVLGNRIKKSRVPEGRDAPDSRRIEPLVASFNSVPEGRYDKAQDGSPG
jgi:hypothetical protein